MTLLSPLRGRTSDNEAKAQEFIVWFATATDVEELGTTVGAQQRANVAWVRLLFGVIDVLLHKSHCLNAANRLNLPFFLKKMTRWEKRTNMQQDDVYKSHMRNCCHVDIRTAGIKWAQIRPHTEQRKPDDHRCCRLWGVRATSLFPVATQKSCFVLKKSKMAPNLSGKASEEGEAGFWMQPPAHEPRH